MADKLLEVKGVSKIFRVGGMLRGKKLVAVDNVSLSIDDDKPVILSIVGESGCGKSTLCKMILRLHNPVWVTSFWMENLMQIKKAMIQNSSNWMYSRSSRIHTNLSQQERP